MFVMVDDILYLLVKLGKITTKVTLNGVVSRIEEHIIMDDVDTTAIIREMRDRPYDY